MKKITLGLSVHRPEMIPPIAHWMRGKDAIYLGELPGTDFEQMQGGGLTVDDYLRQLDWRHLKTYRIVHALPEQSPPMPDPIKFQLIFLLNITTR